MEVAFGLVLFAGFAIWIFSANAKAKGRRQNTLLELSKWLGGTTSSNSVRGTVSGTPVTLSFVTRGSGSSSESWTEIDAELPARYPLTLLIRPHAWRDSSKIERGEMIDVQVGDPAFDDRFLVEAAPADVARMLFDHDTRKFLLAQETRVTVTTEIGTKPLVRLAIRKWLDSVAEATPAIEIAASLARRVRNAYAELEASTAPQETGSPYRPVLDDRDAREAADARLLEVANLERIRAERTAREKMVIVAIFIVFVLIGFLAMGR